MNCRDVNEFLAEFLDGTLQARQRVLFKLHLLLCRDCRRYLASYTTTVQLMNSLGLRADWVEDEVPRDLVRAILAVRTGVNSTGGETPPPAAST